LSSHQFIWPQALRCLRRWSPGWSVRTAGGCGRPWPQWPVRTWLSPPWTGCSRGKSRWT